MSSGFAVNQYDDAFRARRLQQYTVPKQFKEYPFTRSGSTKIVASDLGHLLPGVGRSEDSPWGDFKGTWDLPNRLPGNHLSNPCARRTQPTTQQPLETSMPAAVPAAESSANNCPTDKPRDCQSGGSRKKSGSSQPQAAATSEEAKCCPTDLKDDEGEQA